MGRNTVGPPHCPGSGWQGEGGIVCCARTDEGPVRGRCVSPARGCGLNTVRLAGDCREA